MSSPRQIDQKTRRESIAKLTRSPLSRSPVISQSPGKTGSPFINSSFIRAGSAANEEALDSHSSSSSAIGGEMYPDGTADYQSGLNDPKVVEKVNRHLNQAHPLKNSGGDITHDLYKIGQENKPLRRCRSFSPTGFEYRRGSTASSLNVPGGFRRDFIRKNQYQTEKANFLTKNFLEFLSIYGHFAGEQLEDEDGIACHYEPYIDEERIPLNRNIEGTASDMKAYFLLLKAFVGTGVLFLPKAFSNGGLVFSVLTLLFFGALSFWCYLILILAKRATNVSGFGEIGLKLYGKWLQHLILFSIVLSQVGFVAAYIVFTAENLKAFVNNFFGSEVSVFRLILLQIVVLVPLSLIRDITKLSLSALMANVFILLGLGTIVYFIVSQLSSQAGVGKGIEPYFNSSEFSLFIGVAIFAFEGIGLIIPIEESMREPRNFPKVLFLVIVSISVVFIGIGSLGYLTYGQDIETVILLNLPQDSSLVISVQLLYSLAILLSTPIQLFPAIRLVESKIFTKTGKYSMKVKWLKNFLRFAFVILVATVALYGGQNLDKFVSFVGCFACIPLVYMYPPILHMKSCCSYRGESAAEERKKSILKAIDLFLVVIGTVALVYTTYDILS